MYEKYTCYSVTGDITEKASKTGRPRTLNPPAALGALLMWTRTRGAHSTLCLIFGVTLPRFNLWLRFSLRILLRVLRSESSARVVAPSAEKFQLYVRLVAEQYSIVGKERVAFAIDGLKLHVCKPGCNMRQIAFYNGWTSGHYISNIFVFAPDGTIAAMVINAPGAMHDSTLMEMGGLYDKMEVWAGKHEVKMVVDSAFQCTNRPFFIRSAQDTALSCDNDNLGAHALNSQATSVRQYAEWDMRGFKASFPRANDRIKFEERGERMLMMQLLVRLYNFRCNMVGINQIRNFFLPALHKRAQNFEYIEN